MGAVGQHPVGRAGLGQDLLGCLSRAMTGRGQWRSCGGLQVGREDTLASLVRWPGRIAARAARRVRVTTHTQAPLAGWSRRVAARATRRVRTPRHTHSPFSPFASATGSYPTHRTVAAATRTRAVSHFRIARHISSLMEPPGQRFSALPPSPSPPRRSAAVGTHARLLPYARM